MSAQPEQPEQERPHSFGEGARFLLTAAAFVIVILGLQAARSVLLPIQLAKAVRRIAIGFLLIHLHIKINGFDLLSDFVGWLLVWLAVRDPALEREQPKTSLLRGFALALWLWSLPELVQIELPTQLGRMKGILDLIMALVGIYFYFQLLTELAQLAEKYAATANLSGGLLKGRTWLIVLRTASVLLMSLKVDQDILTVVVLGVLVVIGKNVVSLPAI